MHSFLSLDRGTKHMCLVLILVEISHCYYSTSGMNNEIDQQVECNDRPVVGILAQESYSVDKYFPNEKYHSYIAASYVKYMESAGARVIPIMIGKSEEYYEKILKSINGILFPGGATFFNQTNGYADNGVLLYNLAKAENLPVLGICLGMELITFAELNKSEHRVNCDSMKISLPLNFKKDYATSKMFRNASSDIIRIFETENVTYNYHKFCITESVMGENIEGFNANWQVIATNLDKNGIEFISAFESRKKPIYGIQFHPEKNIFEWAPNRGINHTGNAVRSAQFLAEQFVEETRNTRIRFDENQHNLLIYNYPVSYIGNQTKASYQELYMFK